MPAICRRWQRKFEDPIPLPGGRNLVTLQDANEWSDNDGAGREGAEASCRAGVQSRAHTHWWETEAQGRALQNYTLIERGAPAHSNPKCSKNSPD